MLTARAISVTGIILGSSLVAVAIAGEVTDCQTSVTRKDGDLAHWSWRTIDGKQCWYLGRPGMDKARLQWPQSTLPSESHENQSDRRLLESYWPDLQELMLDLRSGTAPKR